MADFPTGHAPTLYGLVQDPEVGLPAQGYSDDEVETSIDDANTVDDFLHEHDLAPPAVTTNGARAVMRRLTEAAGIDAMNGEYLKPHGGRRGLEDTLYRDRGARPPSTLFATLTR